MCQWSERDLVCPRKAEIGDFDESSSVNQQILWLHITMNDSARVAKVHCLEELSKTAKNYKVYLADLISVACSESHVHSRLFCLLLVNVSLEIHVQVLKDQINLRSVQNNIDELDDVRMLEFFQRAYFSNT